MLNKEQLRAIITIIGASAILVNSMWVDGWDFTTNIMPSLKFTAGTSKKDTIIRYYLPLFLLVGGISLVVYNLLTKKKSVTSKATSGISIQKVISQLFTIGVFGIAFFQSFTTVGLTHLIIPVIIAILAAWEIVLPI